MRNRVILLGSICLFLLPIGAFADSSDPANPDEEAVASAMGHYSRARSLLISAIHEFDRGRKLVGTGPLLDGGQWRNGVIDRAEDLEKVLDPQARTTRSGVRIEGDSRIIGEAKQ